MPDPKLLTENGWKAIASQFKLKDNGLLRALSAYENLADDKQAERLTAIGSVNVLAGNLKKDQSVVLIPRASNYLADMISAAESAASVIAKAKAVVDKKAGAEAKKEEKEEGDYVARFLTAIQKLKSSKNLSFEFIVCDAKPHCGLMVAKRITAQHKEELTRMTGGGKRFLHVGTCCFADGKFTFTLDQPVTGLAKRLQDSIKFFTGKKLAILVGTESVDDDDEKPAGR
jgi:hypothetical protein